MLNIERAILVVRNVHADGGPTAVFGESDQLANIASGNDEVMPAREMWRRRAETTAGPGEASPQQMARGWRWYRCGVEGVYELIGVGELLPNTALPWVLPVGTVTAIDRPAFPMSFCGFGMDTVLEDEPDPGA